MFNFLNIYILKLKRVTDDEMVGWHHQFRGHELGKLQETVRDREAGMLQSMGLKQSDMTERLNNSKTFKRQHHHTQSK